MELPAGKFYQVQPFDTNLVPISWTISFDFGIIFFVLGKWRIQFWHWNFGQFTRGTLRNIILLILFPLNKFSISLLQWARDQYLVAKGLTCLIIWNNVKHLFYKKFIHLSRSKRNCKTNLKSFFLFLMMKLIYVMKQKPSADQRRLN